MEQTWCQNFSVFRKLDKLTLVNSIHEFSKVGENIFNSSISLASQYLEKGEVGGNYKSGKVDLFLFDPHTLQICFTSSKHESHSAVIKNRWLDKDSEWVLGVIKDNRIEIINQEFEGRDKLELMKIPFFRKAVIGLSHLQELNFGKNSMVSIGEESIKFENLLKLASYIWSIKNVEEFEKATKSDPKKNKRKPVDEQKVVVPSKKPKGYDDWFPKTEKLEEKLEKQIISVFNQWEKEVLSKVGKIFGKSLKDEVDGLIEKIKGKDFYVSYSWEIWEDRYFKKIKLPVEFEKDLPGDIKVATTLNPKALQDKLTPAMIQAHKIGDTAAIAEGKINIVWNAPPDSELKALRNRSALISKKVTKDLNVRLKQELLDGVRLGETIPQLKKRVSSVFSEPIRVAPKNGAAPYLITNDDWAGRVARSEVMRASNQGKLYRYQLMGVTEVRWLIAWDERTCSLCKPEANKIYKIEQAFGLQPLHTRCRCTWAPYKYKNMEAIPPGLQRGEGATVVTPTPTLAPAGTPMTPKPKAKPKNVPEKIQPTNFKDASLADAETAFTAEAKVLGDSVVTAVQKVETEIGKVVTQQADLQKDISGVYKKIYEASDKEAEILRKKVATVNKEMKRLKAKVKNLKAEKTDALVDALKTDKPTRLSFETIGEGKEKLSKATINKSVDSLSKISKNENLTGSKIRVTRKKGFESPHYDTSTEVVNLAARQNLDVTTHEMAHWFEHNDQRILKRVQEFYEKRTKGEALVQLKGFKKGIKGKKDKFLDPYTGRRYFRPSTGKELDYGEVLSNGIEQLFKDPVKFIQKDFDHFRFTVGVLRDVI